MKHVIQIDKQTSNSFLHLRCCSHVKPTLLDLSDAEYSVQSADRTEHALFSCT